ncbi:MAG: OmpA family protein [Elusimicrobiota bacterium]|nr:MAG: OmpA family protein [Elusimicrobiota bacterium]
MRKIIFMALAVFALAACTTPGGKKGSASKGGKAGAGAGDGTDLAPLPPGAEVTEAGIKTGSGFEADLDIKPVAFDYDSAQLSADALDTLKANAAVMKGKKGAEFLVAGHCDERGTVAYNLALGQKRAKEVRDYYMRLGVDGRRIATISYGKEMPSCSDSTEDCWSKNRRAVTGVRVKSTASK